MEITIYASDVKELDERIDRAFDISNGYGYEFFDENDRLTMDKHPYCLEPYTYLAVLMDMQEQLNELRALVSVMTHQHEQINELRERVNKLEEKEKWHGSMLK